MTSFAIGCIFFSLELPPFFAGRSLADSGIDADAISSHTSRLSEVPFAKNI
jgi:hypothetical protein